MVLTPKADRQIDALTCSVIREVKNAGAALGLDPFLVGAAARIILLENVFGLHTGRATRDIDFAFALGNWAQFQAFKDRLTTTAPFEETGGAVQRLVYKATSGNGFVVDLIPFGGLENSRNTIAWPPDNEHHDERRRLSRRPCLCRAVEIEPGIVISIASIPGLAVLKLFAWIDRRLQNPKDAFDFLTLLRQYNEAGNQERLYEDAITALEAVEYDVELAGAWLLGRDAFALSSLDTRVQLSTFLGESELMEGLGADMSKALRAHDTPLDYSRALLDQFLKGYRS